MDREINSSSLLVGLLFATSLTIYPTTKLYAQNNTGTISQQIPAQDDRQRTTYHLIKQYGPPTEKVEREINRTEIWRYSKREFEVQDGLVVSPPTSPASGEQNNALEATGHRDDKAEITIPGRKVPGDTRKPSSGQKIKVLSPGANGNTRDLLGELMKQFPDGGTSASTSRSMPMSAETHIRPPAGGLAGAPPINSAPSAPVDNLTPEQLLLMQEGGATEY